MKYQKKISIILFSLLLSFSAFAQGDNSLSTRYQSFDVKTKEREEFVETQNAVIAARLKESSNYTNVRKKIFGAYDKERVIQTEEKNGTEYKLIDPGLGKPQKLIATTGAEEREIFSTYSIQKNNSLSAHSFILSPLHDKVVLVLEFDGSLDDFVFIVIDLKTLKNLTDTYVEFVGDYDFIYWDNNNDILVNQKNEHGENDLVSYSFGSGKLKKKVKMQNQTISQVINNSWLILADPEDENIFYSRDLIFKYTILKDYSVIAEKDGVFYLSLVTKLKDFEFTTYYRLKKGETKLEELFRVDGNVTTQFLLDNFLAVITVEGPQFYITGIDLKHKTSKKIIIPNFLAVSDVSQTESFKASNIFQVSVVSDLKEDSLEWDYTKNQFIDVPSIQDLKDKILTTGTLTLSVEYRMVKSTDGTLIPIRLVYKAGTSLLNRQVYMESYGGFLVDGYLAPMQDKMRLEFIKRGGVYIGTGLRGGNEYGQKWHDQAVKEHKIKVIEDLSSIAKWIIDSKLAVKENIVSAGSSNGGFVVTLCALIHPESFGLVIAHNGVLDLLVKEKLDKRNDGGWVDEFGDSTKTSERPFVFKMSPLENVAKIVNGPRFLLINGKSDTRVNPAHSIKFAKAALDLNQKGNVNLEFLSTPHSGHFNLDPEYNDTVGARALSVKWSTIFDYFGMDF
ncbi:MAG: prolyl oligopeptidase family serine peptidase, partial [Bdellovibrionales bacterium]|nr:prolyl oligopeptidase family serine peptidase [Bdellovibrionales bacterium]